MPVVVKDVGERLRDIRRREVDRQRKSHEPRHNDLQATIKSLGGSTSPTSQPGKTWVAFLNQPESLVPVWNPTSLAAAETHVWVGPALYPPFGLEIKGPYQGEVDPTSSFPSSGGASGTAVHGSTHQVSNEGYPGGDPVNVYQAMLQPLKSMATTGNLMVFTMSHTYHYGGKIVKFMGKYQTMASYVPAAGLSRKVLIYLNPILNQLVYVAGSTVVTGAAPIPYPECPAGMYPSAYVNLVGGQTSISTYPDIEDVRDFLRPRPAEGGNHSLFNQDDGLHSPYRWIWANVQERSVELDVNSYDVANYTVGLQLDTGEQFRASDTTPTFERIDPNVIFLYRSIVNHVDGTWYSLYTDNVSALANISSNTAWQVHVDIVGKTNSAFSRHWMYWGSGGVANHNGTVTASVSVGGSGQQWESDSGYEVQAIADDTNDALDIQVRRNGGVNWYIAWRAKLTITPITFV